MCSKLILASSLLLLSNISFAEQADYMDQIAQKTCECVGKVPADRMVGDHAAVQLGLCMIQSISEEDRAKIKQDHNIDTSKFMESGEKLGALVGEKMIMVCPDVFTSLFTELEKDKEPDSSVQQSTGTISKVEKNQFIEFTLSELDGGTSKYIWLTEIESNFENVNKQYSELKGKSVTVNYESMQLFDAKLGQYRAYKVLKNIEIQ